MHRIDGAGTSTVLPAPKAAGTPGFFTNGNPATGVPATVMDDDWFNAVQEEILSVIIGAGLSPDKMNRQQLLEAVQRIAGVQLVRTPVNLTPLADAIGIMETPLLKGNTYYSLYGIPMVAAQFQIGTGAAMDTLAYEATVGATVQHSVQAGTLATATNYWWRARYQDGEGNWSLWSLPTKFTTAAVFQYVRQAVNVSPADNAAGLSTTPTLQSSAFAVYGAADLHSLSQWQLSTDANFAAIVHDSGDSASLVSYDVPAGAGLAVNSSYYWRVRHKGAVLGWGDWSNATRMTVDARPAAPTNISPADGAPAISLTPTLQSSGFAVLGGSDSHIASQWQVATTAAFGAIVHDSGESASLVSYAVPSAAGLVALTTYHWRVRHKGSALGWGDWSVPTSFTTAVPSGFALFTTPGPIVWVAPDGVTSARRRVIGGGGGGGADTSVEAPGIGGPGRPGGIAEEEFFPIPGQPYPGVVGAGGAWLAPGGTTSMSDLYATGGARGRLDTEAANGAAGMGFNGDINEEWSVERGQINGVSYGVGGAPEGYPGQAGAIYIWWGE